MLTPRRGGARRSNVSSTPTVRSWPSRPRPGGRAHRVTVYRWLKDADFRAALQSVAEAFFQVHRAKVLAAEAARQQWRAERERQRWPMRCENLARAREAKRRRNYRA
jgi:hypothetical protein